MYAKKNSGKKVVLTLLAIVLLIGCTIGGTVAYLQATKQEVTNTFVAGNIGTLTLTETTGTSYTIIPGVAIAKDPVVTFHKNNIPAYVFVKVDASDWNKNGSTYTLGSNGEMSWSVDSGWTELTDDANKGVFYKAVAADADTTSDAAGTEKYPVIAGNSITVSTAITEATIANYAKSIKFTAYAIQQGSFATPDAAWAQVNK